MITYLRHNLRCIKDSLIHLYKNLLRYILFIIPLSVSIFLILISYNTQKNIEHNFKYNKERIIIFLKEDISSKQIKNFKDNVINDFEIISFKYLNKEESLRLYSEINKQDEIINNLDYNPLPQTIIIEKEIHNGSSENLYDLLKKSSLIESFNSNTIFLERIIFLKDILLNILIISFVLLLFILIIFINYYIKIEISSNKNKIYIYFMIGARESYIRREYLYLPIIAGLISCMSAYLLFQVFYFFLTKSLNEVLASFGIIYNFISISFVEAALCTLLVIIISISICLYTIHRYLNSTFNS